MSQARRVVQRRAGNCECLHRHTQRLAAGQPGEPLHFEIGHDHDLHRARFRLAALEVRGHELRRDEIVRLHAFRSEVPIALHFRVQSADSREHDFLPRAVIDPHHLHDPREAHVVTRAPGHFHEFVGRRDEIFLRLLEHHGGEVIEHRAQLILRAELVDEPRLFRHEMHAIRPARGQWHARREPSVRQRHERNRARLPALIQPQLAARHRLVRRDHQLDLRAFQRGKFAGRLPHRLRRAVGVGRKVVGLFKSGLVRARHRAQFVAPRERVARLHAIAHRVATDLDRRGKAVAAERRHLHHAPALHRALRLQLRGLRFFAAQLHDQPHHVAVRHGLVAGLWLDDLHLRRGNALQIRARHQRPQEKRTETEIAQHHEGGHRVHDHRRHADGPADQRHRQERRHFQTLHPRRDIRLQQLAELRRVENLAMRAPEFHRREQILAQLRLCVLDEPCDLPLVGRVQELRHALPPRDGHHRRVSHRAERPPYRIRQEKREIHRRHDDHRAEQHRRRREHPAQQNELPPPPREGLEFLQDDGIGMGGHGGKVGERRLPESNRALGHPLVFFHF